MIINLYDLYKAKCEAHYVSGIPIPANKSLYLTVPIPTTIIRKALSLQQSQGINHINTERAYKWRNAIRLYKSQHPAEPEPPYITKMRELLARHESRYGGLE